MSHKLLISDANIVIDVMAGGILEEIFSLDYEFAVPDVLFHEELREQHPDLPEMGLTILALDEAAIIDTVQLGVRHPSPEPYAVHWQVTNSGDEALEADEPRGDFYPSEDPRKKIRWETTGYRGTHWVKALILNDQGVCVAQSNKFLVGVR